MKNKDKGTIKQLFEDIRRGKLIILKTVQKGFYKNAKM